ncbi:MAG: hypothetical protein IT372_15895 [Polyangiaceae bacterium]|nr:hypothetical protein [Polyangiaceae bacterium]
MASGPFAGVHARPPPPARVPDEPSGRGGGAGVRLAKQVAELLLAPP